MNTASSPDRERQTQKNMLVVANKISDYVSEAVREHRGAVKATLITPTPKTRSPWHPEQMRESVIIRVHVIMKHADEFLCKAADALYFDLMSLQVDPARRFTDSAYLYVVREPDYQQYHTYVSKRPGKIQAGFDTWTSVVDHYGAGKGAIDQASMYVCAMIDWSSLPRWIYDAIQRQRATEDGPGQVCMIQLPPALSELILKHLSS